MKGYLKNFIVIAGVVFCSAVSLSAFAADKNKNESPLGKTYYTAVNIWYEDANEIYTTNYHKGVMLPINTKATITGYNKKEVKFKIDNGIEFILVYVAKHSTKPMKELFNLYFSEKELSLNTFNKEERENIKNGTISTGMRKDAVLAAYGYPPSHATPSTEANQWKYWRDRFRNFLVTFNNNEVAVISGE